MNFIRKKVVPKIGDTKKDKMKHSLAMTTEERERQAQREIERSRNVGSCMSDLVIPGPGAYHPSYSMLDKKEDKVSHAMRTGGKRFTYFEEFMAL